MNKYPEKFYILIDNMIKLHFCYEDMYEQIKVSFPEINITMEQMQDIIIERVVNMI